MRLDTGELFNYLKKHKIVILALVTFGISSFLALQFYGKSSNTAPEAVVSKPEASKLETPKPVKVPESAKPELVAPAQADTAKPQVITSNSAINQEIAKLTENKVKQDRFRSKYRNYASEVRGSFINSKMLYSRSLDDFLRKLTNPLTRAKVDKIDTDYIKNQALQGVVQRRITSISMNVSRALKYDYNADNKITTQELEQAKRKEPSGHFATSREYENKNIERVGKMDLNSDGSITIDEVVQFSDNAINLRSNAGLDYHSKTLVSLLALDSDGDNAVTVDELKKVGTALYNAVDTNGDKTLSQVEKEIFISKQAKILQEKENIELRKSLNIKGNEELHIVSVYEGYVSQNGDNTVSGDHVDVVVDRPGKDVILLLSSYRPVKWNIKTLNNTKVKYFMSSSRSKNYSKVFENGSQVEFKEIAFTNLMSHNTTDRRFAKSKIEIKEKIGLEIASFSGEYKAKEAGFVVNAISNDEKLKFTELKVNYGNITLPQKTLLANVNSVRGEYNVKGELISSFPQKFRYKDPYRVVYVKDKKQYYEIYTNSLKIYDDQGMLLEEVGIDITQVPQMRSRIAGVTYDKKNDRIVVLCPSHSKSYLYFYSLASKTWSAVNFAKGFFYGLDYDASSDRFVTIKKPMSSVSQGGDLILFSFGAQGNRIKEDVISADSLLGFQEVDGHMTKYTLAAHNNQVIIAVAGTKGNRMSRGSTSRVYLYDENSRKSYLTWFSDN